MMGTGFIKRVGSCIAVLILFFFIIPVPCPAEEITVEAQRPYIQWGRVEGAVSYEVEIKGENDEAVFRKRVTENRVDVNLPPGKYKFRVGAVNKFEKVGSWTDWGDLELVTPVAPELASVSVLSGIRNRRLRDVTIRGRYLKEGIEVFLEREGRRIPAGNIRRVSEEELSFDLDLKGAVTGIYRLVLLNPGGARTVNERGFVVQDPPKRGPAGSLGIRVSAGGHYSVVGAEWSDVYEDSWTGFNMSAGGSFAMMDLFQGWPYGKYSGAEGEASFTGFSGKPRPGIVLTQMSQAMAGANLWFRTWFNFPLNAVMRFGGGVTFTTIDEDRTYGTSENFRSSDAYFKAGAAIEWSFHGRYFLEAGSEYLVVTYLEEPFRSVRTFFRAGVYL